MNVHMILIFRSSALTSVPATVGDVLMPIPMKPWRVERRDWRGERNGTCVVLMAVEPLAGCRISKVTAQRTKKDYAEFMKSLAASYPDAEKIVLRPQ